jgi:Glycine zipper
MDKNSNRFSIVSYFMRGIRGKLLICWDHLTGTRIAPRLNQANHGLYHCLGKNKRKEGTGRENLAWVGALIRTEDEPQRHEKKGLRMETSKRITTFSLLIIIVVLVGCAGGPLTTREKGAGIGALGGAAAGGLIGTAVGRPGAGAAIGGGLGLGAGALIGDQLQGQEIRNQQQQQEIKANQAEIERQRTEIERIRRQREY